MQTIKVCLLKSSFWTYRISCKVGCFCFFDPFVNKTLMKLDLATISRRQTVAANSGYNFRLISILIFTCSFCVIPVIAQLTTASSVIKLEKTKTAPKIDGIMQADEWKTADKVDLNFQVYPNQHDSPASEKTTAFITYDREHLYVAFHAFDSTPSAIRAPVSKRDNIDSDDYVTVFLDTYDDRQRAYYLSISAAGVQQDGIYTESGGSDVKWDGIFESKGKTTADGYVVEVAIPFKTLRFKAGKDARWGIHFRRWIPRKQERTSWQKLSRSNSSLLAQEGFVTGLEDVFTGSTIDIIPTVTASNSGVREIDPTNPLAGRLHGVNKVDPGVTVIYSITPNATLSATVNPDFSQVEADAPQITVNQRFPISFAEKRPFFLEGSEFFNQTASGGFRLLDTRQIVDPDWGVKFTGKFGRNTFSYLSASDNSAGLRISPNDENFGKNARFNIFRYQRDILKDSQVGAYFTDRRFANSANTVFAGESRLRLKKVNTFSTQFIWSKTKTLNGDELHGYAQNIRLTHYSNNWRIYLRHEYVQPDFRAQSGFISRTNYHEANADIGYEWRPKESSKLSKWLVYIWHYVVINRSGTIRNERPDINYLNPSVQFVFKRGVQINYYQTINHEGYADKVLDYRNSYFSWSASSLKRISFSGYLIWGDGINYNPLNATIGKRFATRQTITLRPFNRLNSEFLYLRSQLRNKQSDERFFNQDIYRNRTIFQFNQDNAFRSIIEYDTSLRRLGLSFLYSYTPRPNTAVYLGYGDALYNGYDPLFSRRAEGIYRQSRSLFAKVSYNFRF